MKKAKRGTVEKRILRALVGKGFKRNVVQKLCEEHGYGDITLGKGKLQINADWDNMYNGDVLERKVHSRSKVHPSVVRDAVAFILHKEHVITTSWGDKKFQLSPTETVILPRLCRKLTSKELWQGYLNTKKSLKVEHLGRSTYYNLIKDLTVSNKEIVRAVDYVQALLVAEPIEVLQQIVDELAHSTDQQHLTMLLSSMLTFLKYRYNSHVLETEDDCVTHGLPFILGRDSKFENNTNISNKKEITCCQCKFPFYVCNELRSMVKESSTGERNDGTSLVNAKQEDAINVIDECEQKNKITKYVSTENKETEKKEEKVKVIQEYFKVEEAQNDTKKIVVEVPIVEEEKKEKEGRHRAGGQQEEKWQGWIEIRGGLHPRFQT